MTHRISSPSASPRNAATRADSRLENRSDSGKSRAAAAPSDRLRRDELARLLPLWPRERDDLTMNGRRRIVRILERALRAERQRGRAGHWAYDIARHAALLDVWRAECAALKSYERACAIAKCKSPR